MVPTLTCSRHSVLSPPATPRAPCRCGQGRRRRAGRRRRRRTGWRTPGADRAHGDRRAPRRARGRRPRRSGRVVHQRLAVGDDGLVDGVPVTAEVPGHFVDRTGVPSHLFGGPTSCPAGHDQAGEGDARILFGPGTIRAVRVMTDQLRLYQTSEAAARRPGGRPGRLVPRSFATATTPQVGHPAVCRESRCGSAQATPSSSSTPSTSTSGKPTSSSHMRVGSVSTGALQSAGVRDRQVGRAPAARQGPP